MGSRVELSIGGTGLRRGTPEETRYVFSRSLDTGAIWIAAAAPLLATLIVLCAL